MVAVAAAAAVVAFGRRKRGVVGNIEDQIAMEPLRTTAAVDDTPSTTPSPETVSRAVSVNVGVQHEIDRN